MGTSADVRVENEAWAATPPDVLMSAGVLVHGTGRSVDTNGRSTQATAAKKVHLTNFVQGRGLGEDEGAEGNRHDDARCGDDAPGHAHASR